MNTRHGYDLVPCGTRGPFVRSVRTKAPRVHFSNGVARRDTPWWGREVDLTFRFLDPDAETRALAEAGLVVTARLDRAPDSRAEHASERCYLLVRASDSGSGS